MRFPSPSAQGANAELSCGWEPSTETATAKELHEPAFITVLYFPKHWENGLEVYSSKSATRERMSGREWVGFSERGEPKPFKRKALATPARRAASRSV